jgi:hypothetical protein
LFATAVPEPNTTINAAATPTPLAKDFFTACTSA